ncbi:MAG: asparagine synthetase B, partial [Alphaproteobacteria bacterium]
MCGIAGLYAYAGDAPPIDREALRRMNDRMAPRGPDGEGFWTPGDGRIGFAHRRLSIIEVTDAGAQPMHLDGNRRVVTFNGEICNFRALRAELEQEGRRFETDSDTEVLLHLYDRDGAGMVSRLRGMFAFAIWDAERKGVFLARDGF